MRQDDEGLKGHDTCEVLVCLVLEFGMDHINNLKVKGLTVPLHSHFESEKLKGSTKKVELVELLIFLEISGKVF